MMDTWLGTVQRKAVTAIIALGCSLGVSGCLTVKSTTTVLEDGRIIDQVQVLPKRSLWAIGTLFLQIGEISADKPHRSKAPDDMRRVLSKLRHGMEDTCVVANFIWGQPYTQQSIPVSATRIPLEFGFSNTSSNGCQVQIGPYDPRALLPDVAADLGLRIVPLTGLYSPYKLLIASPLLGTDTAITADIDTLCKGEIDTARCRDDFSALYEFVNHVLAVPEQLVELGEELNAWERHALDLYLDENPDLLVGIMEVFRMVFKDITVVSQLQDGAAVGRISSLPHKISSARPDYTREGIDWFWRGNMMDVLVDYGSELTVHPTRAVGG